MKAIQYLPLLVMMSIAQLGCLNAQSKSMPTDVIEIEQIILSKDSAFWAAYNACDMSLFPDFITEDLEFYHDKGGLLEGSAALLKTMSEGLCGNTEAFFLRREAIPGSVDVYPLAGVGAIISGEHLFYINEAGKEEYLDGRARFTHVWRFSEGDWKMSRVLSYDHRPATEH